VRARGLSPSSISSLQTFAIYTIGGFVNEPSTMFEKVCPSDAFLPGIEAEIRAYRLKLHCYER
jgi:hypothetical protein